MIHHRVQREHIHMGRSKRCAPLESCKVQATQIRWVGKISHDGVSLEPSRAIFGRHYHQVVSEKDPLEAGHLRCLGRRTGETQVTQATVRRRGNGSAATGTLVLTSELGRSEDATNMRNLSDQRHVADGQLFDNFGHFIVVISTKRWPQLSRVCPQGTCGTVALIGYFDQLRAFEVEHAA